MPDKRGIQQVIKGGHASSNLLVAEKSHQFIKDFSVLGNFLLYTREH